MEINNNNKSIIYNSLIVTMILLIAMLFCFGNYVVFAKGILNDNKIYEIKNPNSNCFQVFVSAEKNAKFDLNEKKETYLNKFVVPILNFDVKSLNYEAKNIIVRPLDDELESFKLTPTFLNITPTDVSYFEIDYEPNNDLNRDKINETDENGELGVYSFDIQIKTFIDLYKSDD